MNMKLPPYLQEEVENLAPFGNEDLDFSEFEWMADQELEEFDRQVSTSCINVNICVYKHICNIDICVNINNCEF